MPAPPRLASRLQSLPPILHKVCQHPMPGYSKGSRGLSVYPRVLGIFTETPISPRLQFHRADGRDSAQIVTPFVQVGTYPTRNFATLGPFIYVTHVLVRGFF